MQVVPSRSIMMVLQLYEMFGAYDDDYIRVAVAKVYRASYYYYMILASTDEDTMGGGVEVMVQTENENQYYNYSRVFTTVSVLPIVVRPVL